MKLIIYNGSPRRKNSNSDVLIGHFLSGYKNVISEDVPVYYLAGNKQKEAHIKAFEEAESVIVIFPLYTDCMPGIVKTFFEDIASIEISQPKKIGFVVQSGFPEAVHSVFVERYLQKLTQRLKCKYIGTIIKGGIEGIRMMPDWMTRKTFNQFQELGQYFAKYSSFSPVLQNKMRKPYKMSLIRRLFFNIMIKIGVANFYWDKNLKQNGAFEKRFDRPYTI